MPATPVAPPAAHPVSIPAHILAATALASSQPLSPAPSPARSGKPAAASLPQQPPSAALGVPLQAGSPAAIPVADAIAAIDPAAAVREAADRLASDSSSADRPAASALQAPRPALDAYTLDPAPSHALHATHGSASRAASPAPERADLASAHHPEAPAPAGDPDLAPSPGEELGRSSARITVGEGDNRVSLLIHVRGDAVRVDARAHSAVYADALNQRTDELASGLAERGLVLGSLSADVTGERAAQPPPRPDDRPGRHRQPDPDRTPDPDPHPDRPHKRGLRAIA